MGIKYPKNILTLMVYLKKLPGVGAKTAERFAFELIKWEKEELASFGNLITFFKNNLKKCITCGCMMEMDKCHFCNPHTRDSKTLCIIASEKDAYLLEDTNSYKGFYHVVSLISPINGYNIDEKNIIKLEESNSLLRIS